MIDQGYAAVSTRKVAAHAALKPALVHYYYRTTDDLLLAVFRRACEMRRAAITRALAASKPLRALWSLALDPKASAITTEFNALANHRKAIAEAIAQEGDQLRAIMAKGIADHLRCDPEQQPQFEPTAIVSLLLNAGRGLVCEQALGMSSGQQEAMAFVEHLITLIETTSDAGDEHESA